MASVARNKVMLACTECKQRNYNSMKNKKNTPDRIELNKYCRFCKKHTGFVGFFKRIGLAFRNMWHELRKVTWPTREKLVNYSVIVVLFMLFMMVIIGLLDTGATQLVNLIMSA